jgi:hypothetical protein
LHDGSSTRSGLRGEKGKKDKEEERPRPLTEWKLDGMEERRGDGMCFSPWMEG